MIERIIYNIINEGLQYFKDDPARFERFLVNGKRLKPEEAAKGRIYFEGDPSADPPIDARPPTLIHGYARQGGPFPCWALSLVSETIATDYLGKSAAFLDSDGDNFFDTETGNIVDPKLRRLRYQFDIMVHTDHPDITLWYYHLLKFIVLSHQKDFEANDIEDLEFSGGDLSPDPRYLPSDWFSRRFSLFVFGDECWTEDMGVTGGSVGGIFYEGVEGDIVGVDKANVTVIPPGE